VRARLSIVFAGPPGSGKPKTAQPIWSSRRSNQLDTASTSQPRLEACLQSISRRDWMMDLFLYLES
jgi:hypothetical protein